MLARTETSTKNKRKKEFFLSVQILSLDEKLSVVGFFSITFVAFLILHTPPPKVKSTLKGLVIFQLLQQTCAHNNLKRKTLVGVLFCFVFNVPLEIGRSV